MSQRASYTTRHLAFVAGIALLAAGCAAETEASQSAKPDAGPDVATSDGGGTSDVSGVNDASADVGLGDSVVVIDPAPGWESDMLLVPYSVHLTWQGDPATTLTASWATTTVPVEEYTPMLWIVPKADVDKAGGAMPFATRWTSTGYGNVYHPIILGAVLDDETYSAWHVEVTGLQPDTEYVYRVGTWEGFDLAAGGGTGAFAKPTLSAPHTVKTGLPKGHRETFEVVLAGDSRGGYEGISAQMPRLAARDTRMWFFNGDMNDTGAQLDWDTWFQTMAPVLTTRVLMPVQGNHELIFSNLYYVQFELPRMPLLDAELEEHAWSVDFGNVHFVGLDSNGPEIVAAQVTWLDGDLSAARADPDIDFIICMMHHSAYSNSNHGSTPSVQEFFVPLFEKHNVDLVFAGHDHNYERTVKMREAAEAADGVTYVVAGAFFSPPYGNGSDWYTAISHPGDKANYVVLTVNPDTLNVKALTGDGTEVLDEFSLNKRN